MESLVNFIIDIFGNISNLSYGKEIIIFIISTLPILELRGGILAAALLGMDGLTSFIICVVANILVIPIALYLLEFIFNLLKKVKGLNKVIMKIENKTLSKREKLDKYGYLGLVLFVGIPLPGTGVWTGCFLASLLKMDKKKSFLSAMVGVLVASIIMMILSFGILKNIIN